MANLSISVEIQNVSVSVTPRAPIIVSIDRGATGPQGPAGPSGSGPAPIAFSYGDASPRAIYTPASNITVYAVYIVIDTPFDGAGAALSVTAGATTLMASSSNAPANGGDYEAAPAALITAGTNIVLTIVPGSGASQGAGRIIFETFPSS